MREGYNAILSHVICCQPPATHLMNSIRTIKIKKPAGMVYYNKFDYAIMLHTFGRSAVPLSLGTSKLFAKYKRSKRKASRLINDETHI